MKTTRPSQVSLRAQLIRVAMVTLGLLAWPAGAADKAAPKQPQSTNSRPLATFSLPNTLNEGRDPFHPSSTRVIAASRPIEKAAPGPATLELKGISGTSEQPLAIINNRTFAVGDRDYITTAQGRVSVECLAIEGTKVKVSVQGETRELVLRKGI